MSSDERPPTPAPRHGWGEVLIVVGLAAVAFQVALVFYVFHAREEARALEENEGRIDLLMELNAELVADRAALAVTAKKLQEHLLVADARLAAYLAMHPFVSDDEIVITPIPTSLATRPLTMRRSCPPRHGR